MKLIIELTDKDVGSKAPKPESYRKRESARGVVYNPDGQIALLHVGKFGYHKLPGGGLEDEETVDDAIKREVKEEVGAECKDYEIIGYTHEWKNELAVEQISHIFITRVKRGGDGPEFDNKEREEDFSLSWVDASEALTLIESEEPTDPHGIFVTKRDAAILKEALKYES